MSILLTTVAYCGKTSTNPSSSRRISASRIGVELTPNCSANALRDRGEPGGSASEVISLRSRSNTCGAACRSRSRRPADRLGGRRKTAGEGVIRARLDDKSNSPEDRLDLRCTNVLVACQASVNKSVAAVEDGL